MSASKRKQEDNKKATESAKKRIKIESKNTSNSKDEVEAKPAPTSVPVKTSLLSKELAAFPRGGAGPLSLLEQKQIRVKASRDAEKEHNGNLFTADGQENIDSDDSELDLEDLKTDQTFVKKKESKKRKTTTTKDKSEDKVHIDSISHKRLTDGSLLLGCISSVTSREIVVSLPNNLVGFVSPTAVSAQFNSKLEASLQDQDGLSAQEDGEDSEEAVEKNLNIDLSKHFQVGQLLRTAYIESDGTKSGKSESRKRINLSIDPRVVNKGITKTNISQGVSIQASVVSVEDHGVVVDIGLGDGTSGFILKKALPPNTPFLSLEIGSVLLCSVSSSSQKGRIVQLSADLSNDSPVKSAASVDVMLPGTAVEVLLTQIAEEGLAGKVMGLLDVTADNIHSSAFQNKENLSSQYSVGQKLKGRLIANFPLSENKRLAFSILPDLVTGKRSAQKQVKISSTIPEAEVISVTPRLGIFVSLPGGNRGFVHISRLADKTVETLSESSGPYKIGSKHKARVLEYNLVDALYILSLQQSVIDQQFLRIEDVPVGQVVKGTIEKVLVGESGVRGVLVNIASGLTGFVQSLHLSDVVLKTPEMKFREGLPVTARVLRIDLATRQMRLTLKKSLVNNDSDIWKVYDDVKVGDSSPGTLVKVESRGAVVQFLGDVTGYLPVAEMSEAYIKDAREHFKAGQVLTLYATSVDSEAQRINLSVKGVPASPADGVAATSVGSLVAGLVIEKTADDVTLNLQPSNTRARLFIDHVSDGSEKKRKSALDKIRVGQKLEDLLVLDIQQRGRLVNLCNRASIKQAAVEGKLLTKYEDLEQDKIVTGLVSNITEEMVFVKFAADISGVIHKPCIPDSQVGEPDFGMKKFQAITARVLSIDYRGATPRFRLTMKTGDTPAEAVSEPLTRVISNPVDENIKSEDHLKVGAVIKARITSVKETQINVEIAKGIQGRVDVSEVFDSIDEIKDRKHPLKQFSNKQVLTVRILGAHDSRSYRFLPISHRGNKNTVYELSARQSMIESSDVTVLKLSSMKVGDEHMVFVNNIGDHGLMVNVSPAVRGRIKASDVSDDLNLAANLPSNFPIGSVLKAKVTAINIDKQRLDLSAKTGTSTKVITLESVSSGDIVAGRITKVTDRSLIVQLSETLTGTVDLINMADDFDLADPARFQKNEIVRAYVLRVDIPNKKIFLSTRLSKILSSSLDVKDPEVSSVQDINVNDIRRGFISNITEKGVFVTLGHDITGFVRVTNLSDEFLKEWKDHFQKDQLVQGRIILADRDSGHVQMSLKKSHISGEYRAPISFNDLSVGDVVEGRIAKVESFGVFIVVANSENVRGLCHRSEIADRRIEDVTKLSFSEGDVVKAKVLKIEPEQRKINFGMKASYFIDEAESSDDENVVDSDVAMDDTEPTSDLDEDAEGERLELDAAIAVDELENSDQGSDSESAEEDSLLTRNAKSASTVKALSVGGFDWSGTPGTTTTSSAKRELEDADSESDVSASATPNKKKKKTSSVIVPDLTASLDSNNPQTPDDFERLLLPNPADPSLWLRYIAYQLDLGDISTARAVAERALASMPPSHTSSKLTMWTALLNLENTYGTTTTLADTLERAAAVLDPEEIFSRLASILIQSGKHSEAKAHFDEMLKRFTQSPKLYINYATFLFDQLESPTEARALLPRALQALPPFSHFDITSKFAQLEFKTKTGVPEEGRTRFQGLINLYPKRLDLFHILLDLETKILESTTTTKEAKEEQKTLIRGVFEQVLAKDNLKPAKVKPFFERWLKFEKKYGGQRHVEEVEGKAARWVADYAKKQKSKD